MHLNRGNKMAHPHWLLRRVAELEKDLVMQEKLVTAYQIIVNDIYTKEASKEQKKYFKENKNNMQKRLKKLAAKAELLEKIPETKIAFRSMWEEYK